jgi:hypothetical protein
MFFVIIAHSISNIKYIYYFRQNILNKVLIKTYIKKKLMKFTLTFDEKKYILKAYK